jgi:glycolate oxidase FAD binding subunit
MSAILTPTSAEELIDAVRSAPRLIAVGAGTKPRLSAVDVTKLSTVRLSGVVEYEPSEFTITAQAGTPVREIAALLAQHGQYLPFDPMLTDAGATVGGMVASGLSGPGRFRFGGVRDFILCVRFVDGAGRLLRLGGKVVKNAAGFDLPKFFVGSLGRFGVLVEITFKVFPLPASRLTLKLSGNNIIGAARILMEAANTRWEPEALDLLPDGRTVLLRLGGPFVALQFLAREILSRWQGEILADVEADSVWTQLREFHWAHANGPLIKVPLAPAGVDIFLEMLAGLDGALAHVSSGGNVAYVSLATADQASAMDEKLRVLALSGLTLRGAAPLWLGQRNRWEISAAVKSALDAENRFPGLDD